MGKRRKRTKPYARRTWRGVTLENRMISAVEWAEKHWQKGVGKGKTLVPSQGSFSTSVSASGNTHALGSALDVSVSGMTPKQRRRLVRWLRRSGMAAYYRAPLAGPNGWGPHIHMIQLGGKHASDAARWQMAEYLAGRNALTNAAPDRAWRPKPIPRWSHRRNRPITK